MGIASIRLRPQFWTSILALAFAIILVLLVWPLSSIFTASFIDNTTHAPTSPGGPEESALQGGINATHKGDPAFDTADFADTTPGNLRADYVLPDRATKIVSSFVFWPLSSDPLFPLVGTFDPALLPNGNGFPSSDHRLVAVDVKYDR